jgi:ankyrin repeat protein
MSSLTDAFNRAAQGGETPLMQAARKGNLDIVKMLLDKGADIHVRDASLAYLDNQADGFKADPPEEFGSNEQADGYKGPPDDDAIAVMKPLNLKRAKKKIIL